MTKKWGAVALLLAAFEVQSADAEQLMTGLAWEKRVLLIFAPDAQAKLLQRQDAVIAAVRAEMIERDMAVIRVSAAGRLSIDGVSHDDASASFYRRFGTARDRFRVMLVGKDGTVKLDRHGVVSTAELFALIDSMPMRRYEMLRDE
ncbi:MAG: hypothetical protein [Olavius algarvensis Gamma 3 endosymbiont]|nr:MAG: hypothetical protein [Olavius algarvensis Gamma 3 endosymbiont]